MDRDSDEFKALCDAAKRAVSNGEIADAQVGAVLAEILTRLDALEKRVAKSKG